MLSQRTCEVKTCSLEVMTAQHICAKMYSFCYVIKSLPFHLDSYHTLFVCVAMLMFILHIILNRPPACVTD